MTSSHPLPPRASGSPGSPPPSTAGPHPGSPCCSSGPSWPGAGGPSPPGSGRPSSATGFSPATSPSPPPASGPIRIARRLLTEVVRPLLNGATRLTLALDDTPTKRYGPHVQGAGIHHNPTPGPAGSPYVYGHVFVVLGLLVTHKAWGTIALPLLARLYVRKKDLPGIDPKHRPAFRTKLELAVEMLRWAKPWLGLLGCRSGWWPTGPMPRRPSSSRRWRWA